jgi:hypothetical protein
MRKLLIAGTLAAVAATGFAGSASAASAHGRRDVVGHAKPAGRRDGPKPSGRKAGPDPIKWKGRKA